MKVKAIIALTCISLSIYGQTLKNEVDSMSYAFGVFFARSAQANIQQGGFPPADSEILVQAFQDVFLNEAAVKMSPDVASMYLNALHAKMLQRRYEVNFTAGQEFLEKNKDLPGVFTLPSGLQYKIITAGEGPRPTPSDRVTVHYHGTLIDGTVFDSSVERGQPAVFGVTQVIQGWVEALQLMPVGSKWMLYIPSDLAYGNTQRPSIEPYSTLIFEVELISIDN